MEKYDGGGGGGERDSSTVAAPRARPLSTRTSSWPRSSAASPNTLRRPALLPQKTQIVPNLLAAVAPAASAPSPIAPRPQTSPSPPRPHSISSSSCSSEKSEGGSIKGEAVRATYAMIASLLIPGWVKAGRHPPPPPPPPPPLVAAVIFAVTTPRHATPITGAAHAGGGGAPASPSSKPVTLNCPPHRSVSENLACLFCPSPPSGPLNPPSIFRFFYYFFETFHFENKYLK